jgi:phospholipid/cholesterol/gamma-HCH transport system permease protein
MNGWIGLGSAMADGRGLNRAADSSVRLAARHDWNEATIKASEFLSGDPRGRASGPAGRCEKWARSSNMIARGVWQLEQFGRFVDFAARTLAVLPRAVVERFGEVVWQFEQVAVKSLPIVLGAGISVGLVTWLQTHRLLVANGAESALPSFLAVAVVVEIGPVLAGVLVASRMGAGLAAELGSMRLNEEIEARIVLGADPVPSLVAPRAIACALAVPLLTVLIDASALFGALVGEVTAGKLSPLLFWRDSLVFLRLSDVIPATLKTAVFGLLVGLIGCWTGLNADRSTEAVGRAATRGVVRATLAVFAANVILVPCIQLATEALGWGSL